MLNQQSHQLVKSAQEGTGIRAAEADEKTRSERTHSFCKRSHSVMWREDGTSWSRREGAGGFRTPGLPV